jgi:hypothetical protein
MWKAIGSQHRETRWRYWFIDFSFIFSPPFLLLLYMNELQLYIDKVFASLFACLLYFRMNNNRVFIWRYGVVLCWVEISGYFLFVFLSINPNKVKSQIYICQMSRVIEDDNCWLKWKEFPYYIMIHSRCSILIERISEWGLLGLVIWMMNWIQSSYFVLLCGVKSYVIVFQ